MKAQEERNRAREDNRRAGKEREEAKKRKPPAVPLATENPWATKGRGLGNREVRRGVLDRLQALLRLAQGRLREGASLGPSGDRPKGRVYRREQGAPRTALLRCPFGISRRAPFHRLGGEVEGLPPYLGGGALRDPFFDVGPSPLA